MERANLIALFTSIPVAVAQFGFFILMHGTAGLETTWNSVLLIALVLFGIVVHELLHGIGWVLFGRKPFSTIKFGFQWKTFTPYAHLTEPVEINAYRIGTFLPGLVLGILVYGFSLLLGDGNLFWFSLVHTSAAGGDWLILWLLRNVKSGSLVEDHPTNAGCYVLQT